MGFHHLRLWTREGCGQANGKEKVCGVSPISSLASSEVHFGFQSFAIFRLCYLFFFSADRDPKGHSYPQREV